MSGINLFYEILKDPDRKPLSRIFFELTKLMFIYRELPKHYFSRYLFKKGTTNIKDYLPNKLLAKMPSLFNDEKVKEVLDNKLYFNLFYSQLGINIPKILMYNHKKMFVLGNESFEVYKVHDFVVLLEKIFDQHPAYDSIMIKKIYSSSSGKNIFKLFLKQFREGHELINEIYSEITNSEFLFQETLKQHPVLDKLNPSSLNTVRIDTFIDRDGKIDIMSAYLRMSINESYVDNISSGGCMVGIDLQTGTLKKIGYSRIKTIGVKVFKEHPITKTTFEGLSIPFFSQVKELVLKAARLMPGLRLVGWDVAIGESGPLLIEGNSDYIIRGSDFAGGGYLANATFRKVLQEINYL